MSAPLMRKYEYYQTICEYLAKGHVGEYVAIKGTEILGFYTDYMAAAEALYAKHEQGSVFIKEIRAGKDALLGIIHTPGIVAPN